jgi:predicted ester cyclase
VGTSGSPQRSLPTTTCGTISARRRRVPERPARRASQSSFRQAFPDLQWTIDLVLAENDLVAARWTASGTHTGSWGGLAPTGRRADFSGVNIFRFGDNGKVAEIWNHRDDLGLMEQLGVAAFAGAPGDDPS